MSNNVKNQESILNKLGIESLNKMQEEAKLAIHSSSEVVLLSPTGTGKTLAFLLPIVSELDQDKQEVQALIITPTRELAIQIETVTRDMGSGHKVNAVYGGRNVSKDKIEILHNPSILIGTPGRIAHHIRKKTFNVDMVEFLVLDEFDKSLEIGFEEEMSEILDALKHLKKKILTSATDAVTIPEFLGLKRPIEINYLHEANTQLEIKTIVSADKDKLPALFDALCHLGEKSGIVFCNYKDSIDRISTYLDDHKIPHGIFYGGMEQVDRERSLIKFRNGTHRLIIATDLAARGIDVPELDYIIHYHLPHRAEEFTHRNGRTARMNSGGTAYVMKWDQEDLPDFIQYETEEHITKANPPHQPQMCTLFISGGRKDKISKGDIAGLFMKQGRLDPKHLGVIELKQDCAFVAIHKDKMKATLELVNNTKLKNKKVRITLI